MKKLLVYRTRIGAFYIVKSNGEYHPMFEDETLGAYSDIAGAVDDLAGGHTFSIRGGVDTARLGIPSDPSEWEKWTED